MKDQVVLGSVFLASNTALLLGLAQPDWMRSAMVVSLVLLAAGLAATVVKR